MTWQTPIRPLRREHVFEFLRQGLNTHEIATAGGITEIAARVLIAEAGRHERREVLHLERKK